MTPRINGVAVDLDGWTTPQLAAVHELLRQRALTTGLLTSDTIDDTEVSLAIERLLEQEVGVPEPSEAECHRYFDTHPGEFRRGELVFLRHILFQMSPGVPVQKLRALAERTLAEIRANPDLFASRAHEMSNCPSSLFGGNLGQVGRGETVPEFEVVLFGSSTTGILPELVKTRYGFHIVAIDRRISGEAVPFAAVQRLIAKRLSATVQERALAQYVAVLAGQADIEGMELAAAASPLVQ